MTLGPDIDTATLGLVRRVDPLAGDCGDDADDEAALRAVIGQIDALEPRQHRSHGRVRGRLAGRRVTALRTTLAHTDRPEPGRVRRPRRRLVAGVTLGLAGVGAALVVALGGSAASPAFAKTGVRVIRQADGSVLMKVNVNASTSWVGPADRKLAAMGIDEQITLSYANGAAPVSSDRLVGCTPLGGAAAPSGPPVKVLFSKQGTAVSGSGNTGAGNTTRVSGCVYYKTATPRDGGTGKTGAS